MSSEARDQLVKSDYKSNSRHIIVAQAFNSLADALASAKVVLPWLMGSIGVPTYFTGLLVPVRESGSLLPQIAVMNLIQRLALRKYAYSIAVLIQSLCVTLIACTAYAMQGWHAGALIVILVALMSLARGVASICSKDVLGKTIPRSSRGQVMGYSSAIAGGIAIAIGIAMLVDVLRVQNDLIWFLIAAAGCWILTAIIYAQIKEQTGEVSQKHSIAKQFKSSLGLLKTDLPFRRFILVRTFLMSSSMSAPYLVLLSRPDAFASSLQASENGSAISEVHTLGALIALSGLASLLSGRVWGKLADQSSRRVMSITAFMTGAICLSASVLAFMPSWFDSPYSLGIVMLSLFFSLSITHQGVRLGRKTYIVDLADGNERTQYVATSNSLIGLLLLLVGIIGAAVAQISIALVLLVFGVMAFTALALSWTMLESH